MTAVQRVRDLATAPQNRAGGDRSLALVVVLFALGLTWVSLREYMAADGSYLAAPDFQAEILPALNALRTDGWHGWISNLPGYPGAAFIELIPAQISVWLGVSEAWSWRIISIWGISILTLAILSTIPLLRSSETTRGAARTALLVAVASPTAYWALRIGHPEELMSTGFLLAATVAAAKERPILAGLLLGLSIGKVWPAVAALPVLALLLPDWKRVAKAAAAAALAVVVIIGPSLLIAAAPVQLVTDLGQSGIFNVGHVFWFFGDPIPSAIVQTQTVPQPRGPGPVWSGELSHPLIFGVGTAVGLVWGWTLLGHLTRAGRIAALRLDGLTRSREETTQLASAAMLVMAGILFARCFLDTWNVPYYLLPGLVFGALGEMLAGRRPILALVATGVMWRWHAPGDLTVRSDPDVYTAFYLSWVVPFGIAYLVMGFRAAKGLMSGEEPAVTLGSKGGADVTPPRDARAREIADAARGQAAAGRSVDAGPSGTGPSGGT